MATSGSKEKRSKACNIVRHPKGMCGPMSGRPASVVGKESMTMAYSKPRVSLLGHAVVLLQGNPKTGAPGDFADDPRTSIPAYEIDES